MSLQPEYKNKIVAVLSALFPDTKIILYGSRARGDNTRTSDIDVALDAGKKLDTLAVSEARSMLSESYIPYKIDLVDVHNIPQDMKKKVLKDGIVWKN